MIALLGAALFASTAPSGLQIPQPLGDAHMQVALYDRNGVVALEGQLGFQTAIELDEGEKIENVAVGNAAAWQLTPNKRADILFVKPLSAGAPTNMTIVSNRRTYAFLLTVATPHTARGPSPWVLRFRQAAIAAATAPTPEHRNSGYTAVGAAEILPIRVYDDGVRTTFVWPDQAPIPAIFAVNPDGTESTVNSIMREGASVVQQTAGRFVLRLGDSIVTVTSTPGVERRTVNERSRG